MIHAYGEIHMPTHNRILSIIRETDESRKEQLLTELHNEIVFGGGTPLDDHELDDVSVTSSARNKNPVEC
jgi:hypothetical protein